MKKFNQSIQISIEVDDIAEQLLSTFPEDYKHRELLSATIIGSSLNKGTISMIYNALNGFTGEIDFVEGDVVDSKEQMYTQVKQEDGSYKEQYVPITNAKVISVDIYRDEKILVEFTKTKRDGTPYQDSRWINHRSATKVNLGGALASLVDAGSYHDASSGKTIEVNIDEEPVRNCK